MDYALNYLHLHGYRATATNDGRIAVADPVIHHTGGGAARRVEYVTRTLAPRDVFTFVMERS